MKTIQQAKQLLMNLPHTQLGFYPSPLHQLPAVSDDCGVDIYMKREDFSGITLFGGNKIRKLEYLLGDAKAKGCDTVITYGATQSNHAMETATAARKCGMTPILYLAALVEPKQEDVRANLLLDTILGAEIHILAMLPGETIADTFVRLRDVVDQRISALELEGHHVYDMPSGGSTPVGVCGVIGAFVEMCEQMESMKVMPSHIFTATGTGGTVAGLAAGKALLGRNLNIVGIQVSAKEADAYKQHIAQLANGALQLLGAEERVTTDSFCCDPSYYAPGYEIPSVGGNDTIRYLARNEGLFTDPVYSGKGLHGMLDYIRKGKVKRGDTAVFVHTGGATALFSEAEIIGDLRQA